MNQNSKMKSLAGFINVCYFISLLHLSDAGNCKVLPDLNGTESCCPSPPMGDEKIISKCQEEMGGSGHTLLESCKIVECTMKGTKLIKDNDIDKEATMKFVDLSVTDSAWKSIYKLATEECLKEVDDTFPEIQKKLEKAPFNIKKDQCNAKYMELVSCIESQVFMNCPKGHWKDDVKCNGAKSFITNCKDEFLDLWAEKLSRK